MAASKVMHEGWMVRYGRRKIGRSYIHMRYFVLESRLLAYYKRKPVQDAVPIKTLLIGGNCRVEDRGLKTHHGHMVYVLSIYNKKEKYHRITEYIFVSPSETRMKQLNSEALHIIKHGVHIKIFLLQSACPILSGELASAISEMAAFNIQEALIWKEKIEAVIDQHQDLQVANGNKYISFEYKSGMDNGGAASLSDHESQFSAEDDEEDTHRETTGNVFDWTQGLDSEIPIKKKGLDSELSNWRLLQCQNGLRIFEELLEVDTLPRSCSRAMKAVGVVKATCEEIFELVMSMDATRFEWDCSFQYGSLVEEVDGHTAILYHRLQLDWYPMFVWPRDLCYVRYWRRNDDGSYVLLFRSREHENCGPQPGCVRAHLESGGFNISPLKPRNGRPRTQVQHLLQIDPKGWGAGYISSFQQHCVLQMLNSVAGLREWFSQTDKRNALPRIPVMVNRASTSFTSKKNQKPQESSDQSNATDRNSMMMDEYSDEDEEFQVPETEQEAYSMSLPNEVKGTAMEEEPQDKIDVSCFSGNLRRDDRDKGRDCWTISDGNNFRVRSKHFCYDKTKIPAGKHLMDLVAVDWFKDSKRIDHVARRQGCAAQVASEKGLFSIVINLQVPGSTHYSMIFYFVTKELLTGSLLQRFVDGYDEFRNSRLKLIPSVPKAPWMVRRIVGSTPHFLGKVVDCNYIRGPKYLEIDVDFGSSSVVDGALAFVNGAIPNLVVDLAFLVQGNTEDELPERLIGAVRVSRVDFSSAIVPKLDPYTYMHELKH